MAAAQEEATLGAILRNLLLTLFTDNLVASAAETNLLPLIVFSVIFAGMLTTMGSRVAAINQMIVQVNEALLTFILLLMNLAPLEIFCLVTARFGTAQAEGNLLDVLRQTGAYFSTVLVGLAVHAFVTLPLLFWMFTRRNPFRFMYQMSQALLTAFSTASSTATLPVTMECAVTKGGCRNARPSSCCRWGRQSTWMGRPYMKRLQRSSSHKRLDSSSGSCSS